MLDPETFRRVEDLFHRALELDEESRARLLDRECAGEPELRREVERLLASDERADEGVERIDLFAVADDPLLGRRLGAWRVVERIASGGMGVVYRAERADGNYEQQAAVKLLRFEAATEEMQRRFELERRLLARLEHPHIARLLDGGRTEHGAPYLVMEYVDGLPIDDWCASERLSLEQRLRLFVQVCSAVHHAHKNLIVHRDLKPNNVLVDRDGFPRLLDFGIARLMEEGEEGLPTHTMGRALTPEYASPEQLQGLPLTTATDVYSLGVVLYQLLTGRRPWTRTGRSAADWERLVSREQPTRPSAAVGPRTREAGETNIAFAAHLSTTPARLQRRLRGDLDRIVMMALRKEPERRYESAGQFAEDVESYLAGNPVRAHRDTFVYRARRFVRRNRVAVSFAALLVLTLCWGLWASRRERLEAEASAVAAQRAEREARELAEHARVETESFRIISGFLGATFLESISDPSERERVARVVAEQAERVRRQYADDPHQRANLLDALGGVYARIDRFDSAEELMREALAIRLEHFGERSLEHALSLASLGRLAYRRGEYETADAALGEALRLHRRIPGGVHTDVAVAANDLATVKRRLGRAGEALALHREALALREEHPGPHSLPVAESNHNLSVVLLDEGEVETAREHAERALAIRERILGSSHPLTLQTSIVLAGVQAHLRDYEQAARILRKAVEGYRARREAGTEGLVNALSNLAAMQIVLGELDAAEATTRESLERLRELYGPNHPQLATVTSRLALVQARSGRVDEAIETWHEVLRIRRAAYPGDHPIVGRTLTDLASALRDAGRDEDAQPLLREALAILTNGATTPTAERRLAEVRHALGELLSARGNYAEARPLLERALETFESLDGTDAPTTRAARAALDGATD